MEAFLIFHEFLKANQTSNKPTYIEKSNKKHFQKIKKMIGLRRESLDCPLRTINYNTYANFVRPVMKGEKW